MRKRILILGSDTKEGISAFNFFKEYPQKFKITGISCQDSKNLNLFIKQAKELNINYLFVEDPKDCEIVEKEIEITPYSGDRICKFTKLSDADIVVSALSGIDSVKTVLSAIAEFKDICMVNFDPILYSGDIIIKDAQNKGVIIYLISLKLYSADLFLKNKDLNSIKYIDVFSTNNKIDKEYLENPRFYSFNEFKDLFIKDFKIDLIQDIFCLNYLYKIPITKIKFFEQNLSLLNLSVSFQQGNTLINSTTKDLNNIFNFYFLDYNVLKNKNLATINELKELNYSLKGIDFEKTPCLKLGIKSLEIGYNAPILCHICCQICITYLYEERIDIKDYKNILNNILEDKTLRENHPDLKTIHALYSKIEKKIKNYIKEKSKNKLKSNKKSQNQK